MKNNRVKIYDLSYRKSGETLTRCLEIVEKSIKENKQFTIICYSENRKEQLLHCFDYIQKIIKEKFVYPEIQVVMNVNI